MKNGSFFVGKDKLLRTSKSLFQMCAPRSVMEDSKRFFVDILPQEC